MTSEGWVRAQLLLATLREPPKRGSLRELVLRLLIMMKEETEYKKWYAIAAIMLGKEKGIEAFKDFTASFFPYAELDQSREKEKLLAALKREVLGGPLSIRKVGKPNVKSRLRARYESNEKSDRVLQRIESGWRSDGRAGKQTNQNTGRRKQ